jgi:PAS domain S-box-containing protein
MTRRSRVAITFVISATVLVGSIAMICALAVFTIRIHDQVLRCRNLIDRINQTLSTLKDAETGQRGYLLTGNDTYLQPYNDAVKAVNGQLASLSEAARAKQLPAEDVDEVIKLSHQKLDELDRTIKLRQTKGLPEALAVVNSNSGKLMMDALRAATVRVVEGKNSELNASLQYASSLNFYSGLFALIAGILDVLTLVWAYRRIAEEIGSRDAATLELNRQKDLLQVTLASIGDGVMVTDMQGRITFLNEVAEKLTGWSCGEAMQRSCGEVFKIINEESRNAVESPVDKVLLFGKIVGLANHTLLIRKDGSELPIDDSGAPIRESDGTLRGAVLVFRDFSEQKAVERRMMEANDALSSANQAKDQFLAALSHELRAPLTPVLAALTSWEVGGHLPPGFLADVKVIRRNVELEARLIDDLLDLTRIARGKLSLSFETVSVDELIQSIVEMYRSTFTAKGIALSVDLKAARHFIEGDPARIQQVFGNILSNAIKFTDLGGKIAIATDNDSQGRLRVTFADTGIGMSSDTIARIFVPFEQSRDGATRNDSGLGLGMSIAKALVDAHSGQLAARSSGPGSGSVFTVTLPTVDEPARVATAISTSDSSNHRNGEAFRILYVEDHVDSADVLARLLRTLGYQVQTCGTVADAVRLAREQTFDLLLSDIGLPDGSGIDLIAQVRQHSSMPAIALTGFGMERDVESYRQAGFNNHIAKPVTFQKLEELIDQVRRGGSA